MLPSPVARALIALLLVIGSSAVPARAADEKPDPARPPVVDPRADELLRAMGDYLAAADQFSFRAEITSGGALPTGQQIEYAAVQDVAIRRPNRAYVEYEGDLGASQLWYDGRQVTVYDGDENAYATTPVPGKLDAALDRLLDAHGFTPPLADLVRSDPYRALHKRAHFGVYVGKTTVDGVRCHHLAFMDEHIDWQIWIEDGTQIVPCKLVITYTSLPGAPEFRAVLSDWEFDGRLADALFTPLLPPSAAKREFDTVSKVVKAK